MRDARRVHGPGPTDRARHWPERATVRRRDGGHARCAHRGRHGRRGGLALEALPAESEIKGTVERALHVHGGRGRGRGHVRSGRPAQRSDGGSTRPGGGQARGDSDVRAGGVRAWASPRRGEKAAANLREDAAAPPRTSTRTALGDKCNALSLSPLRARAPPNPCLVFCFCTPCLRPHGFLNIKHSVLR